MFKIYDGRDTFYQWDTERKLIVYDETIKEVHFCNRADDCSLVCEVYKEGELNLVNVPNILLQDNWRINVYAYDETYTKHSQRFDVKSRSKPADYVYTETEVKNWDDLAERISALEQNSGTGGNAEKEEVYKVNITNDNGTYKADKTFTEIFEAIQQNKIVQAHIEMGGNAFILPLCTLTENMVLVYGGSAATTTLAITHTITGQINIITEDLATVGYVDNAVANIPSGGGSAPKEMELIASGTNTEPVRRFKITTDNDGNAFELTKAYFVAANFVSNDTSTNKAISLEMGGDIIAMGTLQTDGDTKNKEIVAYANSDGVMLTTQGRGGIYAQGEKFYFATNFKPNTTITKVDFYCADALQTFKAGATYELWGVRK